MRCHFSLKTPVLGFIFPSVNNEDILDSLVPVNADIHESVRLVRMLAAEVSLSLPWLSIPLVFHQRIARISTDFPSIFVIFWMVRLLCMAPYAKEVPYGY